MTGFAQERCRFIEKHRLAIHNFDEAVAFVTRNSLVAALQGELCPAMVEVRGLPALGIVAGGTVRLSLLLGELFCMNIHVACFANQRSLFELDFLLSRKSFVAIVASDRSMDAKQGEFSFRVVESRHVDPRFGAVAGFAAELRPIRSAPFLPIAELSMMRVRVTTRTGFVFEVERNDLVFSSGSTDFMAFRATDGDVRAGQWEFRLFVLGDGKQSAVKIRYRMAGLAAVQVRFSCKLAVVGIFVTVRATGELDFINRLFASGNVALSAFYLCVLSFQRILGSRMLLDAKQRRLPSLHFVAFRTLAFLRTIRELAVMNVLVAVRTIGKLERLFEVPASMASNATHLDVFPQQGILCLGVIELERR